MRGLPQQKRVAAPGFTARACSSSRSEALATGLPAKRMTRGQGIDDETGQGHAPGIAPGIVTDTATIDGREATPAQTHQIDGLHGWEHLDLGLSALDLKWEWNHQGLPHENRVRSLRASSHPSPDDTGDAHIPPGGLTARRGTDGSLLKVCFCRHTSCASTSKVAGRSQD